MGPNCKKAKLGGLTLDQKKSIVTRHNKFRKLVKDGKVKNMRSETLPLADPSTLLPLVKKIIMSIKKISLIKSMIFKLIISFRYGTKI